MSGRGERSALHEVNVKPTVIVEVEQTDAATGRHRRDEPSLRAAILLHEIEPHRRGILPKFGNDQGCCGGLRGTAAFRLFGLEEIRECWPDRCFLSVVDAHHCPRAADILAWRLRKHCPTFGVEPAAQPLGKLGQLRRMVLGRLRGQQANVLLAISIDRADRLTELGCEIGTAGLTLECGKPLERRSRRPDRSRLIAEVRFVQLAGLRRVRPARRRSAGTRSSGSSAAGRWGSACRTEPAWPAARAQSSFIRQTTGSSGRRFRQRSSPRSASANSPRRIARWARPSQTRSSSGDCLPARSSAVRTPSIGKGSTSSL